MNNLKKILLAAGFLLTLVSCSDENPWLRSKTEGRIKLQFTADCQVECQTRSDDVSSIVPKENEFSVSLVKSDESYSKEWNSVDAFNKEDGFPIGDYNLSVEYGDIETEGFVNPYYKGETPVHVTPGELTETSLTAALANSMISIRYSDAFKSMFKSYSASVTSENHLVPVIFTQTENRPAYVSPSKVKIGLTMTNNENKTVTIEPASLTVKVKHHHIVTIDISKDSTSGEEVLDIQFEDDVVAETISISLGDDLFNSPAPEIKPQGFDLENNNLKIFEYASFKNDARFDVVAFGGMKSAVLEVTGDLTPSFGNSVELIGADAALQAKLNTEGIECVGFFDNLETKNRKMGVVNLVNYLPKLPHGNYSISLKVTDEMTRVSEPVTLNVEVSEVGIVIDSKVTPSFFDNVLYVDVATDCSDIKEAMTFMVDNRSVEILDIKDNTTGNNYVYRYALSVSEIHSMTVDVKANLGNRTFTKEVVVNPPVINIATDAYAKKVVLKIDGDTEEHTKSIHENIRFHDGERVITPSIIDGKFVIAGLSSNKAYENLDISIYNNAYTMDIPKFTTEEVLQLSNSNFSEQGKVYQIDPIQCGGQWNVPGSSWYVYTNNAKIQRYDPKYWYSNNDETFTKGSPANTWFKVPSTFMENNSVTIRTVGYHTNGTVPNKTAHSGTYYCTNTPDNLLKGIGKLGYNSNDAGNPKFNSRPSKISFKYSYHSENNEKGRVLIQMFSLSGTKIIDVSEDLNASDTSVDFEIPLSSFPFQEKCGRIVVEFISTNSDDPYIVIPSQDELAKDATRTGDKTHYVNDGNINNYHTFAKGSELIISNVTLGYDD